MMELWVRVACLWGLVLVGDGAWAHRRPRQTWNSRQSVLLGPLSHHTLPPLNPISVQCGEDTMVVTVQKDLYGNGKLVKASDLTLGSQQCKPFSESVGAVVFQNNLQDCGTKVQMTMDQLIYSTSLTYNPTSSRSSPITRSNGAVVSIQCFYPRHSNVSSKAIRPTWTPFSSTVSTEERLSFLLQLMNDDFSALRTSTSFFLGDELYIEASVDTENHIPMRILVDSCMATTSLDPNSNPRYEIIGSNGCLMDSKQEDSSSSFIAPRPQPNKLQFRIDAFKFTEPDVAVIYITCRLRASAVTQVPDTMNKACSFSKVNNTWLPVEGSDDICTCCDSGVCHLTSPSRRLKPGHRHHWKREIVAVQFSLQKTHTVSLGPLFIYE